MKTIEYSISEADAVRHLIVCDTQFTWAGVTNLTMPQMMDLQARGWVVEGAENDEFQLTEAGEAVVARALQHGVPKTLADVRPGGRVRLGDQAERARFEAWHCEKFKTRWLTGAPTRDMHNGVYADNYGPAEEQARWEAWQAALAAQPSPGGQGDGRTINKIARGLLADQMVGHAKHVFTVVGEDEIGVTCGEAVRAIETALAARQPVGEPVTVEAVATVRRNGDGDRYIDWLTEGGIADLEVGDVLMLSDRAITDEDGSGEVYTAPTAQAVGLTMPIAMIDQALGRLSTALDDLDSSPDPRPGAMVSEAMACLRQALTGVPNG